MATPTSNSVSLGTFNPSDLGTGVYVGSGYKWGGGSLDAPLTLTYSFPSGAAYHAVPYSVDNEWSRWSSLTTQERGAVRAALGIWSSVAGVTFVELADNAYDVGEIRFARSGTLGSREAAHAYYPYNDPSAGDVWFNSRHFNDNGGSVPRGSYDFLTILHELGHSLGLKHTFDGPSPPAARDNYFYSIMSYTASPWSAHGDNYASFYPTTPMYYDLVAIEKMYGQRAYHTGNDVYKFVQGHKYWQAIHDTGGIDTISFVGSLNSSINLNSGQFSS